MVITEDVIEGKMRSKLVNHFTFNALKQIVTRFSVILVFSFLILIFLIFPAFPLVSPFAFVIDYCTG